MNEVIFDSIKSYTDLGLWLTDVDIPAPEAKRMIVDVPGRDGTLDLTSALTAEPKFRDRKISLAFAMADYQRRWQQIFSEILTDIHGKRMNVFIEPETDFYWNAFCSVDTAKSDRNKGIVKVSLDAYPYKYKKQLTEYEVTAASTGKRIECENGKMRVKPSFLASNACTLTFDESTFNLPANQETQFNQITFGEGTNEILITGSGTVIISYREGSL